MRDKSSVRIDTEALVRERDAYRNLARAILELIDEGSTRGLQDSTVNRMTSRYNVQAMGRLAAKLDRLERGIT